MEESGKRGGEIGVSQVTGGYGHAYPKSLSHVGHKSTGLWEWAYAGKVVSRISEGSGGHRAGIVVNYPYMTGIVTDSGLSGESGYQII